MAFPDPSLRPEYAKVATRIGRAAIEPRSIAGQLFDSQRRPFVVSVAPELRRVGSRLRATIVVGVDADRIAAGQLAEFAAQLEKAIFTVGFTRTTNGSDVDAEDTPWSVRREIRPVNQARLVAPRRLGGPARPGDVICTVRPPSPAGGAEYLDGGGTLGGWVLVDGSSIGLISCAHVLATRASYADRGSRSDVVTWPGWRRDPMSADAAMDQRAIAELSRWIVPTESTGAAASGGAHAYVDAALAMLTPPFMHRGIATAEDPRVIPRRDGCALALDVVRFMGAASVDLCEGTVASPDAQAEIPETGEIGQGLVSYGTPRSDGGWDSVTLSGDSGAWLVRDDGAAVAMHKMAAVVPPSERGASRAGVSTLSYALPMRLVFDALGAPCDLVQRDTNISLRMRRQTVEVLPPELLPAHPERRSRDARPTRGDRSMDSNVTYQFFFGGGGCCRSSQASSEPDVVAEARSDTTRRPLGNQGFPRFARLRLSNGFPNEGSARKVTSATATPSRPHPLPPSDLGPGTPIPVVSSPLADAGAVAHGTVDIGATPANQTPSKIDFSVTHTKTNDTDPITTTFTVDLDLTLGDDFGNNFITEVDVELTRIAATRVKFEVYVTYQLGMSTYRVLGVSKVQTVAA